VAVTQARVPLADLDLASAAGARVLLQRIETAADEVCGGETHARSKAAQADYRACRAQAISDAVASMRTPTLTALLAAPERRAAR
jgi:UrcA family protein